MTTNRPDRGSLSETELERIFETVREDQPVPSEAFLGRLMADAAQAQPSRAAGTAPARATRGDFWASLFGPFGGLPGAAGLAMAGLVGLMIGYADIGALDSAAQAIGLDIGAYDVDDLFTAFPSIAEEG